MRLDGSDLRARCSAHGYDTSVPRFPNSVLGLVNTSVVLGVGHDDVWRILDAARRG